ncbi:hypothetical protein C2845_PM01G33420 [Panicum miliaceum]|uniref:Transposon protein, putative, CACTA, En/Spm sub-class n=1 Tax=Panicum miliaceum TaxID=4540 RepID=A0A3L6TQ14_PANMI|nr:hypothetical protein C2845_PM01G33420 [Panicum miliaceum]
MAAEPESETPGSETGASVRGRRCGGRRRVAQDDNDRASWTPEHTKTFCEIYCSQIDNGNCVRGVMSKSGWKEVTEHFYAATGLLHDNEQFGNKLRNLKILWQFIQKLKKASGLGRRADGSVVAIDLWWNQNTQGKSHCKILKQGWPHYMDELERMFLGVAVDGSTSFVPSQQNPVVDIPSEGEEESEEEHDEEDLLTPLSIGSKRTCSTQSTRSTATSPKKVESPAVRAMVSQMKDFNVNHKDRTAVMEGFLSRRRKDREEEKAEKMALYDRIQTLARECGVTEQNTNLWVGVLKLMKDADAVAFFLLSNPDGRRGLIEHYARDDVAAPTRAVDSDESEDEFDEFIISNLLDDSEDVAFMYGTLQFAMHPNKYCNRAEYREVGLGMSGLEWVGRKLANRKACYNMFRMTPNVFYRLHDLWVQNYGLKSSAKSSSLEALGMFLWMVGAPQSVRQAEDRFERSLGTVHNMFYKVLKCVVTLAADIIKPKDPQFTTMHPRLNHRRFYPFFKHCIGAIDGTHIPVVVPKELFVQHLCRKSITTQNVIACCDFDMIFTFVLAGWPGSVHDMRVFNGAMTTYNHVFRHPPEGKYYLVDSGYPNRLGYLAPYRGTK